MPRQNDTAHLKELKREIHPCIDFTVVRYAHLMKVICGLRGFIGHCWGYRGCHGTSRKIFGAMRSADVRVVGPESKRHCGSRDLTESRSSCLSPCMPLRNLCSLLSADTNFLVTWVSLPLQSSTSSIHKASVTQIMSISAPITQHLL